MPKKKMIAKPKTAAIHHFLSHIHRHVLKVFLLKLHIAVIFVK